MRKLFACIKKTTMLSGALLLMNSTGLIAQNCDCPSTYISLEPTCMVSTPCEKIQNGEVCFFSGQILNTTNAGTFWWSSTKVFNWKKSHGYSSPFMSYEYPNTPPYNYSNWGKDITMTAEGDGVSGDGIYQNGLSIQKDKIYFLQYDYRVKNAKCNGSEAYVLAIPTADYTNTMTEFNVKFINPTSVFTPSGGANYIGTIPTGVPSQTIQQLNSVVGVSTYTTISSCIVADANYDAIWFYPRLVNSGKKSRIQIKNIKLWEVGAGADARVSCNGTYTLGEGCASIPGATYSWSPSTGLSNTNTLHPTVNLSAISGTITYTLTVTVNGCSKTDQITLTQTLPVVNLGPDQMICSGQSVVLNAGNPGLNYLWSNGATTQTITANTIGNYCVTVTNPNTGCASSDCVNIGFYKSPNPAFTYNQSCVNCTEQISVTATYWPSYTHNWELWSSNSSGDFISLLATGSGMNYTFSSGLTYNAYYKVKHDITYPCGTTTSSHLIFTSPTALDPDYNFATESGEYGDHYHIQATPHANPSGISFWWQISDITGGTPTNVMSNPSNLWDPSQVSSTWFPGYCCDGTTLTGKGTYYYNRYYRIERGVWSGCAPWTAIDHVFYVSARLKTPAPGTDLSEDIKVYTMEEYLNMIKLEKGMDDITLYPNPTSGKFAIDYSFETTSSTSLIVVNMLGETIFEKTGDLPNEIDLTGKPQGIYMVKVTDGENVYLEKLIKE